MKDLLWILLFWFALSRVSRQAHAMENYTISCNGTDALISINKTFLASFLFTVGDSLYLVNQSDPQKVAACKLTNESDTFTITVDGNNFDTCFGEASVVGGNIVTSFVVQYFPVAAPGEVVSFDLRYQWLFRCEVQESYNISSSSGILVVAPNFGFNATLVGQLLDVDITFYADNTYTTPLGDSTGGIQVGEPLFVLLEMTGSTNLRLSVQNCSIVNSSSGLSLLIVESSCSTQNIGGVNVTRLDSQRIGIAFPVQFFFLAMGEIVNAAEQFFTIECSASICDNSTTTCPSDPMCGQIGRKRRSIPMEESGMMTTSSMATFHVIAKCDLACSHDCLYKSGMGFFCTCPNGYTIQEDGTSCSEVALSDDGNPISDDSVPGKNKHPEHDEVVPQQLTITPKTTTTTTTTTLATKKKEVVKQPENQEDEIKQEETDQRIVSKVKDVVKESSVLFYGSIVVIILLCVLILATMIQKCRKKRPGKPYAVINEEGS